MQGEAMFLSVIAKRSIRSSTTLWQHDYSHDLAPAVLSTVGRVCQVACAMLRGQKAEPLMVLPQQDRDRSFSKYRAKRLRGVPPLTKCYPYCCFCMLAR